MIRRLVNIEFWTDDKVVNEFTPEDKYFMLYLLTNPHTTQLGIYKLNARYAAFEMGYSEETVKSLLKRFDSHLGLIYWSKDTGEVAIKNYLIHSIIKGGKPVADLLWKEINDVKNKDLVTKVFNHIKDSDNINKTVRNIIDIYLNKNNNINEIHNENENDKSYHQSYDDSCHDSYHHTQPTASTPKKRLSVDRFNDFWNAYPKQIHRTLAEQAYVKSLIGGSTEEWLIDAAKEYALCMQGTESRFVKNPENWLQDNCYLDYPPGTYEKRVKELEQQKQAKEAQKATQKPKGTRFSNFDQRPYDFDDLEAKLLQGL